MKKTKHIQEIRECENTFSRALTEVLNSNSLPNGVVKFCQMEDCRLEKETKQWVWLSYYNCYTHNQSCLLYTSPSPRDLSTSRMPSSA